MKINVSNADKYIRLIVGIALTFGSYFAQDDLLSYLGLVLGMYLVTTGFVKICPLYAFLGINTQAAKKRKRFY